MPRETDNEILEAERQNLIAGAIAETHQEIFRSAFDQEPDEADGDTSLEDPEDVPTDVISDGDEEPEGEEGEEEPEEGEEEGEPEPPPQEARAPRGRPDPRWRDRRVAESERARYEAENRELRARLEALERGQQQPRQQPEQPQGPPDLFVDPEARLAYERNQWAAQVQNVVAEFNNKRINSSFDDVREQVGDEHFSEAFQALYDSGDRGLINSIVSANNPGRELLRWHDRQALVSEIGNDPEAFRDRIRQEILSDPDVQRAVLDHARGQAQRGGNSTYDLPPSLNSASGGMSHRNATGTRAGRGGASDRDIFLSAFDDNV